MPNKHSRRVAAYAFEVTMITIDQIMNAVEDDDNVGFCVACSAEVMGVEPDARNYECEQCGESRVYGAEELLLMTVA